MMYHCTVTGTWTRDVCGVGGGGAGGENTKCWWEMEQLECRYVIGGESDVQKLHQDEHVHTLWLRNSTPEGTAMHINADQEICTGILKKALSIGSRRWKNILVTKRANKFISEYLYNTILNSTLSGQNYPTYNMDESCKIFWCTTINSVWFHL